MEVLKRVCLYTRGSGISLRSGFSTCHKTAVLRKNRQDPVKEEAARKRKLLVPLDEIATEWRQSPRGLRHLQTAANHCDVFRSVFGETFLPSGLLGVTHDNGAEVYRGNVLYPRQVPEAPIVSLPSLHDQRQQRDARFFTLTLTNPDGNMQYNWKELLHWMVVNIPLQGPVSDGHTLYPYVPPLPPQGTGVHRMVFTLYSHTSPIPTESIHTDSMGSWFDKRSFSSQSFLSSHTDLAPFSLAFYQTIWDTTVSKTYAKLGIDEPVYGLQKDLTPRRATQLAVKEARRLRYVYL